MAKKRKPDGDRSKRRKSTRPAELPDRRAMEGVMQQFAAGLQGHAGQDTPLGKAQGLMYRAFEERDEKRRAHLAKEALEICPDCADAYVVLAENAASRKETLRLYEQGLAAGERALGPEAFQQGAGRFWGILETRPYMRARLGLAHSLWSACRREEAVRHLQDMLRLNPRDNQGVRYILAGFLLFLGRDDDLAQLLEQYATEGSAAWAYTRTLLAFRQHGDTVAARQLLKQARKTNKYVPAYLVGDKYPRERPGYYSPGDETEALEYISTFMAAWRSTPGAVAWVRENVKKKKESETPHPKGPLGFIKKWLHKNLPQEYDVWQVDCRQMPNWISIGGTPMRLWDILVTSKSSHLILANQVLDEAPSAALLWDTLVQAMRQPAAGEPHRPTELQVRADERWESLRRDFEEIGIGLNAIDQLDQFDEVFREMATHLGGKPRPGLLDMPGVSPAQAGAFYEAAAAFFRQAPWKMIGYESPLKIECAKFQSGPWYGVLMGQSGLTLGLALYDDLNALQRMWSEKPGDEDTARESVATTVTFDDEWDIPVADLDAARKYGWQVARSDAYPQVFHKDQGLSMRPPLAWELELMEACLRGAWLREQAQAGRPGQGRDFGAGNVGRVEARAIVGCRNRRSRPAPG